MKRDPKKFILPHSEAKLKLYNEYLKRYLRILSSSPYTKQINIYDIFCGTGIYDDGKHGSPILAFETIHKTIEYLSSKNIDVPKIRLIVNDGEQDNILKVKKHLEGENINDICELEFHGHNSEIIFNSVVHSLSVQQNGCRNLVFIDPYGYKDIHKSDLLRILKDGKSEVILFLPVSHMYRFLRKSFTSEDDKIYEKLRDFILDFFPQGYNKFKNRNYDVFNFIEEVKIALSVNGDYYSSSFYIQRNRTNYNAIFFITPNLLGLEKLIEVKWELDVKEGKGFKKQQDRGLFDKEPFESFKFDLENYLLRNKDITNKDLYLFTLLNERPIPHTNQLLKILRENGKIKVINLIDGTINNKGFYVNYKSYKLNMPLIKIEIVK
jgi:three-Cys-motif partner protein